MDRWNKPEGYEDRWLHDFEVRATDDGELVIRGYAAVFDKWSEDIGGFREKVAKGAFSDTLDADVRALVNHDPNEIIGRSKAGTLRMSEDKVGLAVEIDPPASARRWIDALQRGDIDQMSFGFRTVEDEWEYGKDGDPDERTLRKVELFDVSIVTYPAYPDTTVAAEARSAWHETQNIEAEASDLDLRRRRNRLLG